MRDVTVDRDEEHNTWQLRLEDRSNGYPRIDHIGGDFAPSRRVPHAGGELCRHSAIWCGRCARVRSRSARGRRAGRGTGGRGRRTDHHRVTAAEKSALESLGVATDAPRPAAGPARKDAGRLQIRSLDDFVEHFIGLGRKGIAVNRYKGLGEMNPDTLWATTMNPDTRTLLAGESRRPHRSRPDVHDADGRPGRAAPEVHRRHTRSTYGIWISDDESARIRVLLVPSMPPNRHVRGSVMSPGQALSPECLLNNEFPSTSKTRCSARTWITR